jgi:hypothetical protein
MCFSHPSAEVLGAYLDPVLVGANESDASDIAKEIERRSRAIYEGRKGLQQFEATASKPNQ